jgi:hypothetical protein
MRPVLVIWFIVLVCRVEGQIPRTISGQFEYSGDIAADNTNRVIERATSFFNQPFMVHWDSIVHLDQPGDMMVKGTGYINVPAKHHDISTPTPIPVTLQLSIEIKKGHYRYTVNHFVVDNKEGRRQYPLEEKPDSVKSLVYDQLIHNTHKRVSFMIGWLKKYMKGDEGNNEY